MERKRPGPITLGPRNEFSLRVAQSVLAGLRGLTLISVVTIRIFLFFLFYGGHSHKPTISENHEITRRGDVTKRRARDDTKTVHLTSSLHSLTSRSLLSLNKWILRNNSNNLKSVKIRTRLKIMEK